MAANDVDVESRIQKTPGVCGGRACIRATRIPVWLLVAWRQDGLPDSRILEHHPSLTQDDLEAAWSYNAQHRAEIDHDIQQNEEA